MSHPADSNPFENPFEPPAGPPPGHIPSGASETPAPAPQETTSTPPPPVTNSGSGHTSPSPASDVSNRGSQSPVQRERETVNDPRIVALRGMFPDYDDLILQSVLESAGGNQDRAIDILLGMSDPDYRSEAPIPVENPAPQLTQEELDEQFARQLVMQEQQQQSEQWIQAQAEAGRPPPTVHYATRPGSAQQVWTPQPGQAWTQGQPQSQERPSEFQEQFNKIAESGKKTIGNIFSKVKAKIQEFDQGRPPNATSSSQPSMAQQQWSPPPQPPQQQAAYYDPNPVSQQTSPPVSAVPSPGRTPPPLQGYDVSGTTRSASPPQSASIRQQLQRQPSPQPTVVPPPISATLDGGKLGLLPKRPVSLLRDPNALGSASAGSGTSSTPVPARTNHGEDSDDGLEYAENPFETDNTAGKK